MQKVLFLDGIRGLAALIVVFSHIIQMFYVSLLNGDSMKSRFPLEWENIIRTSPINLFYNGNFSVFIFFVLSGYVLSLKFFKTKNNSVLLEHSAKRYPRLAIPTFFSILLVYILFHFQLFYWGDIQGVTKSTLRFSTEMPLSLGNVFYHSFIETFLTGESKWNSVLWTIQSELIGSLLLFLFLYVCSFISSFFIRFISFIAAILIGILCNQLLFVPFFIGALFCDIHLNTTPSWSKRLQKTSSVWILLGIFFGSYPYGIAKGTMYDFLLFDTNMHLNWFYHIIGAAFLILGSLYSKPVQYVFSKQIFSSLGKISFSLYLIHFPILLSLTSYLFSYFITFTTYNRSVFFSVLITIPILMVVSYIFYQMFDLKTTKLLNHLYRNRLTKKQRA